MYISQGSVAPQLRCGGVYILYSNHFITYLLCNSRQNVSVEKI